ncbi:MAG: hypothetical protein EBZ67_16330, partial [Chitinophagia bacterium]|nr:hypothetical protein [Chitinophagia bacterium]
GLPLTRLAPDAFFRYLGIRYNILGSTRGEIDHILKDAAAISKACHKHPYLYHQAVAAVTMVQEARFRYSAPLARWTDAQLEHLLSIWVANVKAALTLSPGTASCIFTLPPDLGGDPIRAPRVILLQALGSHLHQLVALDDDIRRQAQSAWANLTLHLGTYVPSEMALLLRAEKFPRACPIARFLRVAGQLGVQVTLPLHLTGPIPEHETWEGLRRRILHDFEHGVPPTDAEQAMVDRWADITRPAREAGFATPHALHRIRLRGAQGTLQWFILPPHIPQLSAHRELLSALLRRIPYDSDSELLKPSPYVGMLRDDLPDHEPEVPVVQEVLKMLKAFLNDDAGPWQACRRWGVGLKELVTGNLPPYLFTAAGIGPADLIRLISKWVQSRPSPHGQVLNSEHREALLALDKLLWMHQSLMAP